MLLSVLYRIPFNDKYHFEWYHLLAFPLSYAFIKYGWRWIRNIVDITEDDYLKTDSIYYKKAVNQAQMYLKKFMGYLDNGEVDCYAKFPIKLKSGKIERVWCIVHYFDTEKYKFNVSIIAEIDETIESNRKFFDPDKLEDWQVIRDERIIGFFTFLARVKKAKAEGFKLNYQSNRIKESIIT